MKKAFFLTLGVLFTSMVAAPQKTHSNAPYTVTDGFTAKSIETNVSDSIELQTIELNNSLRHLSSLKHE